MVIKDLRTPSWAIMLFFSAALVIVFGILYWHVDAIANPKSAALYAGLAGAFLVAFFQLLSSVLDALRLRKYEKLGVEEILENGRRGRGYYGNLVSSAKKEILVMGVTASRFMSDFGQQRERNNELTTALSRGVKSRFLLPKKKWLRDIDSANITNKTIPAYKKLKHKFGDDIEIKYFDQIAAHSIVVVDKVCISGPVFPDVESQDTPAIVLKSDSDFAKPYMEHFEKQWNSADESFE